MAMLVAETFFITILLIISLFAALLIEKKKIKHIHESALFIFLGLLASWLLNVFKKGEGSKFDPEIFFTIILPPIILAAGYTLKKGNFFHNFKFIALFGGFGTLIAFVTLSFLAKVFSQFDWIIDAEHKLSLPDCMMLACILSSTDTVAALSLVKAEVYPKLNAILFGEGIVNDAVSILLFRTIKTFFVDRNTGGSVSFSFQMILSIGGEFVYLSFFSLLIGISLALVLSLIFKNVKDFAEKPKLETCLILLFSYASYLVAESLHLSGIISLFSCGLVMSHYTIQNISEDSQKGTTLVFDAFGYLAENFVFIYLGITLVNFDYSEFKIGFTLLMILSVFIARFLAIFLPPALFYIVRIEMDLTLKEMKIIWYSGLVRGAISFGLGWLVVSPNVLMLQSTTLGVVIFTIFVLTNLLEAFAKKIGLDQNIYTEITDIRNLLMPGTLGDDVSREHEARIKQSIQMKAITDLSPPKDSKPSMIQKAFNSFESKYVQPIFGNNKRDLMNDETTLESLDQ